MPATPTTTRSDEMERIQQDSLTLKETIIPRLWSDDLHKSLFASTSKFPSRISLTEAPSILSGNTTIRTHPVPKIESTVETTSTSTSSTHLGSKLAGDALVAVGVTFGVSPFLTIVDKAIVESTAGTNSILQSAANSIRSMARNPIDYVKSPTFLLMWAVYGATYTTANAFKTLEEHATYSRDRSNSLADSKSASKNIAGTFQIAAFLGTTVVNSGSSMMKDRAYARMFSGQTTTASFPKSTYAMWAIRDLSVIGSSFLLPDIVSAKLVEHSNGEIDRDRALSMCQIGLPVLAQFVAGPFQYLGLDMYNRNMSHMSTAQAFADRCKQLSRGIAPVIGARVARIIPGYSIGGVANTKLRTSWRKMLLERDVAAMMKTSSTSTGNAHSNEYATRMVALLHSGDKKKGN
jgi:hypothetical protein